MKNYIEAYIRSGAHEKFSGEQAILEFFATLDLAQWERLLFDIAHQELDAFEVIRPATSEFLVPGARALFSRISPASKVLAGQALSRLLDQHTREENEESAVVNLMLMAPSLIGCSESLREMVVDTTARRTLRVEAARALVNIKEESSSFWLNLDYVELPELAPVMVAALASSAPLKALRVLLSLPIAPCPTNELEYPLRAAMSELLKRRGGRLVLLDLDRRLPAWAASIFSSTLELVENDNSLAPSEQDLMAEALSRVLLEEDEVSRSGAEPWHTSPIKRTHMAEGVEVLLQQWSPLSTGAAASLKRIVRLFEHFPSRASFSALVTVGSFYIARLKSNSDVLAEEMDLPSIILEALAGNVHIALIEREKEGKEQIRSLWASYQGVFLLALELEQVANLAFRMLCEGEARASKIASYVVKAIGSGSLTVSACHRILSQARSASFAGEVFKVLGKEIEKEGDPGLIERIGVQLYDFSPRLLDGSGLNLSAREIVKIQMQARGVRDLLAEDPGRLRFMPSVDH